MPRLEYCLPCGEERIPRTAVTSVDGEPMCAMHALAAQRIASSLLASEATLPGPEVELCAQGCGKPRHRGRCIGCVPANKKAPEIEAAAPIQVPEPEPEPSPAPIKPSPISLPRKVNVESNIAVVAEYIPITEIPAPRKSPRTAGRMGAIMRMLKNMPSGQALKIACRDKAHVGQTDRAIKDRADAFGFRIETTRFDDVVFVKKLGGEA